MLDAPTVMGVERIEVGSFSIRVVARTLPGKQFVVGRELRARIAAALREEGITLPPTSRPARTRANAPSGPTIPLSSCSS